MKTYIVVSYFYDYDDGAAYTIEDICHNLDKARRIKKELQEEAAAEDVFIYEATEIE